jgi:hypothetical protein
MKFIFVCPEHNTIFESDRFRIIDDRGVLIDGSGNKTWDAKVELLSSCPFCGKKHIFDVNELVCPFI